jgi:membrane-bound inhibitor of C-type lysozyme
MQIRTRYTALLLFLSGAAAADTHSISAAFSCDGYANRDESFVFWNKGRAAFIEEGGTRTYTGCVQSK